MNVMQLLPAVLALVFAINIDQLILNLTERPLASSRSWFKTLSIYSGHQVQLTVLTD